MEALSDTLFEEAEKLNLEVFEAPIDSKETYDNYADYLRRAKNTLKLLDTERVNEVKPHLEAQREVQARYKPYLEKLQSTIKMIDREMVRWNREIEEKRKAEQRRLEMLARQEEEKRRKILEARALKAEEKGNLVKAEALKEASEQVLVPTPQVEEVKQPKGTYTRSEWKATVLNINKIPVEYLRMFVVDSKKQVHPQVLSSMNTFARATKGAIEIEGIRFDEDKTIVTK